MHLDSLQRKLRYAYISTRASQGTGEYLVKFGLCSVKQIAISKERSGSSNLLFSQFGPNSYAEVGSMAISYFRHLTRDQARCGSCIPLLQDRAELVVSEHWAGSPGPWESLGSTKEEPLGHLPDGSGQKGLLPSREGGDWKLC